MVDVIDFAQTTSLYIYIGRMDGDRERERESVCVCVCGCLCVVVCGCGDIFLREREGMRSDIDST